MGIDRAPLSLPQGEYGDGGDGNKGLESLGGPVFSILTNFSISYKLMGTRICLRVNVTSEYMNPFRPGAGHQPPYLAGRQAEKDEFAGLLGQTTILTNMLLTGLRGVGKTVLLGSFKPLAIDERWIWLQADINESSSLSEDNMATRICTDLSLVTSSLVVSTESFRPAGFTSEEKVAQRTLSYEVLKDLYCKAPGLAIDKIKAVVETAWIVISQTGVHGIVFAYDEAQNLKDNAKKEQFPLSLLLDTFQSLQKKGLPLMLVLTGLPTLFSQSYRSTNIY